VISGFVITSMLQREFTRRSTIALAAFYGRRFLRLTPALALLVSCVAVASALLQSPFGPQQATAQTGIGAMLLSANLVIAHASGDVLHCRRCLQPAAEYLDPFRRGAVLSGLPDDPAGLLVDGLQATQARDHRMGGPRGHRRIILALPGMDRRRHAMG
jgi:hypothetical protein